MCGSPRMLRIEKLLGKTFTVLRLSGRIQEEYLSQLQTEIEQCTDTPTLDLKDVNLLDRPSVQFLMRCESHGIQLVNWVLLHPRVDLKGAPPAVPPGRQQNRNARVHKSKFGAIATKAPLSMESRMGVPGHVPRGLEVKNLQQMSQAFKLPGLRLQIQEFHLTDQADRSSGGVGRWRPRSSGSILPSPGRRMRA